MTPESEIRFVHKHMGLVPGWGGAARLVRIIGSGAALQLLSGAARVDPERALHLGLSEETLSSSDETRALEEAQAWLSQYTEGPASVIQAVKKVVTAGRELPVEALKSWKAMMCHSPTWDVLDRLGGLSTSAFWKDLRVDLSTSYFRVFLW
uniref:Enoyl-CoA hydratase n=1 Tax=Strix occidentalis caurina TaxID=311401 RepID=A0A8D0FCQ8_STROC